MEKPVKARGKPKKEKEDYYTPLVVWQWLIKNLKNIYGKDFCFTRLIDPCAGDCRMTSLFHREFPELSIIENDLDTASPAELHLNAAEKEFWDLVGRYQGRITQLTFDLVSPNMANISKDLKVNLREFYEDTNTHKTKIELTSDKGSHLEIKNDSKLVNSLVDYSAEGGGNIAMRVAGYTKKFHTAQSITEFSVEENLIKGNDWDALNDLFSEILI